jgi:hypothetical protein
LYQISAAPALLDTPRMALKHLALTTFFLGWLVQPLIYSRVHHAFFGDNSREDAK